jgi:hypothetical protein
MTAGCGTPGVELAITCATTRPDPHADASRPGPIVQLGHELDDGCRGGALRHLVHGRAGAVREPEVGTRRRPTPCGSASQPSCRDNALDSFSSSSSSMTCRWTPAGAVCCDGLGPGWSGGWREAPPLGKALLALSPVRVIATSGPATEDPFEGSGPILRDRVRLQHMSGSRCRHLHLGTVAVEPATRQAAGTDDHNLWEVQSR